MLPYFSSCHFIPCNAALFLFMLPYSLSCCFISFHAALFLIMLPFSLSCCLIPYKCCLIPYHAALFLVLLLPRLLYSLLCFPYHVALLYFLPHCTVIQYSRFLMLIPLFYYHWLTDEVMCFFFFLRGIKFFCD
jgi:hypothetical protein